MSDKKYLRYFIILLTLTTLVRIWLAYALGLGIDEAHYVQYAVNPALSYYDHPPLIGYLIRLFILPLGKHQFIARLPAIFAGVGTVLLLFVITRRLHGAAAGFRAAVLFNCIPLFSAVGGITVVPDTILCFFWLLTMLLMWNLYKTGKGRLWYYIGAVTGISLLTKYTAVLIFPSVFLFMSLVPSMRKWFRKKEPYTAFLISFLMFLPVIIWNYENGWASFAFQLGHGLGETAFFNPAVLLRNIGAQAGVFSPFIFLFLLFALVKTIIASTEKDPANFLFLSFSLPVIAIFGYSALSNDVLPHWPAVGYLVMLPVLGKLASDFWKDPHKKAARRTYVFALAFGAALTVLLPAQAVFKPFNIPREIDATNDLLGWEELADRIRDIKRSEQDADFFVFTHTFYIAGQLAFYLEPEIRVYCLSRRIDQYDFWQYDDNLQEKLAGRNGIFFRDDNFRTPPERLYVFREIQPEPPLEIRHRGKYAKSFHIYRCYDFNTAETDPVVLQSLPFRPRSFPDALQRWNEKTFFLINRHAGKNYLLDKAFQFISALGTGYLLIPVSAFLIWTKKRKRSLKYLSMFILAIAAGGLIVYYLKEALAIPRPIAYFAGEESINIIGYPLRTGSFPSGHSQTVFTGTLFLSWIIPKYRAVFWSLGILTGISRCYMGVHFPLDVIAGFFIAWVCFLAARSIFIKAEGFNVSDTR